MADTEKTVAVHENQIEQLKKETSEQWAAIHKIQEYMHKLIPIWVAFVLMASSGLTGAALTFAGMIIKFANSK